MTTTGTETRRWRLVVEYGPEREEIASVHLPEMTEAQADDAARALLSTFNRLRRERGWEHGVSIRMADGNALVE